MIRRLDLDLHRVLRGKGKRPADRTIIPRPIRGLACASSCRLPERRLEDV